MFCTKCGHQNDDSSNFCANCGNALNSAGPQQAEPQSQPVVYRDNSKVYSVLAYIGILWLIGLLVTPEKNDPKVRFHVGQGIILTITSAIATTVLSILSAIITVIFGNLGMLGTAIGGIISGLISLAVSVAMLALLIIGIVNAVKGEEKPLPIVGQFAFYK